MLILRLLSAWSQSERADAKILIEALGKFPAFLDSAKTVKLLSIHYKFVSISDCSMNQIASIVRSLVIGGFLYAFLAAAKVESYTPDLRNFEYLLTQMDKVAVKKLDPIMPLLNN